MNAFDANILIFLHQFAFKSSAFDHVVNAIATMTVFKGAVVMGLVWAVWHIRDEKESYRQQILITTIISGLVALAVGRELAHFLPFRVRPLFDPTFKLAFPMASSNQKLRTWSAFPSDHAMLWFAVATGIYRASRGIGIFALLYTGIVICLPRMYLGLHHPTDILGGAILGVAVTLVMTHDRFGPRIAAPFMRWIAQHPGSFYLVAFMASYFLASQFNEEIQLMHSVFKHLA